MQSTQTRPIRLEARLLAYERRQINTDIHVEEIGLEMTGRFESMSTTMDSGFKEMGDIFAGVQQQLQIFDLHFEQVDQRLDEFGVRLDEFGVRLDEFGVRLDEFGVRLDEFGVRLDRVEARLNKVETRLDKIEATMATKKDLTILKDQVLVAFDQAVERILAKRPAEQ